MVAYASQTSEMNITSVLTGVNSSSYFKFNGSYNANGNNQVNKYFSGSITQNSGNSFSLEVKCSNRNVISQYENGDYYYNSNYIVASGDGDENALILVFGSNNSSDHKDLSNYAGQSSKQLSGNAITSSKSIGRGSGEGSTTLTFSTDYHFIWYHVVYQWTDWASHNNSWLVAGQSSLFHADKTAPTGTLSGVENGGMTNNDVKFTWTESSATATLDNASYTSGQNISAEGKHTIKLTDAVGYSNEYSFTIDKTLPTIACSNSVASGGLTNQLVTVTASDTNFDKLYYKSPTDSSAQETTSTNVTLTSINGTWQFYAKDKAGNTSATYSVIYDNVAPTVTAYSEFVNSNIVFSVSDPHGATIEYWKDNNAKTTYKGDSVTIAGVGANQGTWHFIAYDDLGNKTKEYLSKLYIREVFGNSESIKNSYKVPSYYTVRLSDRYYQDSADTYSFAKYEDALNFAIKKEWEYRIETLSGDKWSYVNISNESVVQIYDDREKLDEAVRKYANLNVSERKIFSMTNSTNAYRNPTDANAVTRNDALTLQNVTLPSHLSQYNGLPLYFMAHSFAFAQPSPVVAGNTSESTITYISNGISTVSKAPIKIEYSRKIEELLKVNDSYEQGYYLIEEKDKCGNVERYLVYLDIEVPTLMAEVETGNGDKHSMSFDPHYVEQHSGVMLYTSFSISNFIDMDECAFVVINGRKSQDVGYVIGDDIPSLCFENGYWGTYTISVYDRSRNILTFNIKIAGELPKLSHTSLTNETRCNFTVSCADNSNAITNIEFFKVTYTGEYVAMSTDDNGTVISAETLTYVIRTGGKYVVRFEDIYGRVVESEPLFYMKGLPSGILSGVKENGITNKDVRFDYASDCSLILYVWKNSQWIATNELMVIEEKEGYNIASISASAETSNLYKYFLYLTADQNLFVEYRFEIDCIAPAVEVRTQEKPIEFETITNKPFFVTWQESNLIAYYYNKNSSMGELGQARYTKDTYISIAGTYVFDVYDSVKNVTSFTVTLDNAVNYTIDGTYTRLEDGSYISKTYISLTVNERTTQWGCTSSNDFVPSNGQKIDIDGTYIFHIEDLYQNTLDITIIIDNLPPSSRFENENGEVIAHSVTNQFFRLICDEEKVIITYSANGLSYVAYEGQIIDKEGNYTFRLADRMNNISTVSIRLDLSVSYSIKGNYIIVDGRYISKNWISVTADEDYTSFDVDNKDGLSIRSGEKISIEGVYIITICDNAGNVGEVIVEIDKTAPTVEILTSDGQAVEKNSRIKDAFRVICDEEGSTVFIAGKDLNYAVYDNESRTAHGVYNFRVVDRIGNEELFSIEIDRSVDYNVRGSYVQADKKTYVSKNVLILEIKESYKNFIMTSDNGYTYMPGERVELEGTYVMEIEDSQGNIVDIVFVIDKTAPTIKLEGVEPNGTTKNNVKICVDGSSANYYVKAGESGRVAFENGTIISLSGSYSIVATDIVGNETTVEFKIDKEISGTATPNIVNGQIIAESISFKFDEKLNSMSLTKDGAELQYLSGKISEPGQYVLIVEDSVGNVQEWNWTIIPNVSQSYQIQIPENYKVSVLLDGSIVADVIADGQIHLKTNGAYTLYFKNDSDSALDYYINVVLDNVAPKVDVNVGKSSVTITNPSKDNLSFVLYKDGKKMDYSLGMTLKSTGKYKLIVTDDLGNSNEYEFELRYVNTSGIIVIVIVCLAVLIAIIMVIVSRRNQRIK